MAHQNTIKNNNYKRLTSRLNLFPQGAVASDLLFEILKILFSEREAELVSSLPIKPFNALKAAGIWKIKESDAKCILNDLADRLSFYAVLSKRSEDPALRDSYAVKPLHRYAFFTIFANSNKRLQFTVHK